MMEFFQRLKRLIRFGVVTGEGTNGSEFWVQQISYLNKEADCLIVFPYGMHAHLPADDSVMNLFFSVEDNPEEKAGIAWTPKLRPDLEPGEIAHYHPKANSIVIYRNNGDIDIDTVKDGESNNININTNNANVTIQGKATIEVSGDVDLTANSVNIDAPVTNLGVSGQPIARVGDSVEVIVTGGSSAGTYSGQITSGGNNKSI